MKPLLLCCLLVAIPATFAADWPTWRGDARRSGATEQALPAALRPAWTLHLPPLEPTWQEPVNQDRMPYDVGYEPIVADGRLFLASNRNDAVAAYDVRDGQLLWRTYLDAPVRFPPAAADGRLYLVCDDGRLHVLAQADGARLGSVQGGLDDRLVLGNERLVSPWCARGGPVLLDGRVHFGAGIWPFMGTFVHAVDAATLATVWKNDTAGIQYLKQPHGGSESFGGVAPQGTLAGDGDCLLVPSGRSVAARFAAATGKLLYFHLDGSPGIQSAPGPDRKLEGASQVATNGTLHVGWRGLATILYDTASGGGYLTWRGRRAPVLTADRLYLGGQEELLGFDLATLAREEYQVEVTNRTTGEVAIATRFRWLLPPLWRLEVPSGDAMILAGDTLVAAAGGRIQAFRLAAGAEPAPLWDTTVPGTVTQLLAAADRLVAVTREGAVHVFAPDGAGIEIDARPAAEPDLADDPAVAGLARRLPVPQGWGVVFGADQPGRLEALLRHTPFRIDAFVADETVAARLRRHFDAKGLYGTRLSLRVGRPGNPPLPPHFAALVIHEGETAEAADQAEIARILRPYGGLAWFPRQNAVTGGELAPPRFAPEPFAGGTLLVQPGRLPGSADWTHLNGDMGKTAKSDDRRVRLPLGLLWFGGNTHDDVLPRHAHGPTQLVVGGRLFLQGVNLLSARDVYTGMVLWRREFDDLGTFGVYYDKTYNPDPADTTYNQIHIPGANARGTNMVAAPDTIYLSRVDDCLALDPATGETIATFRLPPDEPGGPAPRWAYLGVVGPWLVGGAEFAAFDPPPEPPKEGETPKPPSPFASQDRTSSRRLVVLDRRTGEVKWQRQARLGFRHNAVCASDDTLFCLDIMPPVLAQQMERRGETPPAGLLLALDLATGEVRWQSGELVFGTWLSYSREHALLVQCGRTSRDMLSGEPRDRMAVLRAATGEVLWDRQIPHGGPVMLHGDRIILPTTVGQGRALHLLTGEPFQRPHPITGVPETWTYFRRYGCNSEVAAEHFLAFRSGAAGFLDLETLAGTGNFGGFKSGCTTNLIAADGVLNAPDYTRTCTCSYQNQASLALVPMPDLESWTANAIAFDPETDEVRELGLNLGAPGDRRDEDGLLWFDYPVVGGPSPTLPVELQHLPGEGHGSYHLHSSRCQGPLPWVGASGEEGIQSLRVRLRNLDPLRTLAIRVADGADDAEEINGRANLASSDLELTRDGQNDQLIALRFPNLPLEPGDRILAARLRFTVKSASQEETKLRIRAENASAAAPLASGLARRPVLDGAVEWTVPPWPAANASGKDQTSPDLGPLLAAWFALPGWQAGNNALVLRIDGTGDRCAWSANGKAEAAPVLEITYRRTLPPPPPLVCDVRLVFAEPRADARPGQRRFTVSVQGRTVAEALDLAARPGPRATLVHASPNVTVDEWLEVVFTPEPGSPLPPVLSGLALRVHPPAE